MSNPDSFIDEVTEDLRRDRLFATFRRYGWVAILAVLLVVGGAAWTEWTRAQDRATAQAYGDALFAAVEAEDSDARLAALQAVTPPAEGAAIRDLLLAAEMTSATGVDTATAMAALTRLSEDPTMPAIYRDLATLRLVLLTAGDPDTETRLARIEALSAPSAPFRQIAREQHALLLIEIGQTDAALDLLDTIFNDAEASTGQRQRAAQLIVSLGGDLGAAEADAVQQ